MGMACLSFNPIYQFLGQNSQNSVSNSKSFSSSGINFLFSFPSTEIKSPRDFSHFDPSTWKPCTFRFGQSLLVFPICILWHFDSAHFSSIDSIKLFSMSYSSMSHFHSLKLLAYHQQYPKVVILQHLSIYILHSLKCIHFFQPCPL